MTTDDRRTRAPARSSSRADIQAAAAARHDRRRATGSGSAALALAVVVIGGWQWFTTAGWVDKFFFGQPSGIWNSLVHLFTEGTAFGSIWENLWVTVQEAFCGFLLGTVAGVVARHPARARTGTSPTCSARTSRSSTRSRASCSARSSSWRSASGSFPKVLLAAVLVFFVVFFNAFQGVREVDQNLVANVRVLGASPLQVARHVTIPSAMTWIIASLHTAFGFAIIGALVAEVLGAQHGIGLIISQAQGNFDPNTVFACMVIIAVVTLVAEYLITLLEHALLNWRPPSRSEAQAI